MTNQLRISFGCIVLLIMWSLACAPPPVTIRTEVTSKPSGASVSFGRMKDAINEHLGVTPYTNNLTGPAPAWAAGYYRVEKKGYAPQIQYAKETYSNRALHFDLLPLPALPTPPKVVYPDPESVAIKPLTLDIPEANTLRIDPNSKIATMTFKQQEGTGAGSLVADSLILNLQRLGFNVIDRELIESVLKEHNIIAEGKTTLSDLEVSKKIGQLFNADYFVSGAITEYTAQSQNVQLSPMIPEEEKVRYIEDYNRYVRFYQDEEITPPQIAKSIQEWELEYTSRPKSSFINFAKVGITLKIVDIRTSKIVWVGIAYTSDLRLQDAMKRIVDGMIKSFTASRPQPAPPAAAPAPAAPASDAKPAAASGEAAEQAPAAVAPK